MQEAVPNERRGGAQVGPTFFDFIHPPELRVETVATGTDSQGETSEAKLRREHNIESNADDVTAELVRLFEKSLDPPPPEEPENGCTV
jgi:hypothetical protein